MLPPFELLQPQSLPEVLQVLADGAERPLAGGTNLFPDLRSGREKGDQFISLAVIDDLRYIEHTDERITLGAGATISDILRHPKMETAAPALLVAANLFAGAMVRTAATIGGNVCCGSPSADTVPPLLTLGADVTLASASGERTVPLDAFYLDYKKTVMKPDELLTAVSWAPPAPGSANLFYKLGRRKGDAITVTGVAVMIAAEAGTCTTARIALGSVAPTVFRSHEAEDMLVGRTLTPELIEEAAQAAADQCSPIDDIRASARYRLLTAHSLVRRLLTQAWKQVS